MSRVNYSDQDKEDSRFFMMVFQYFYSQSSQTLSQIAQATGFSTNSLTLMKNGQKVISFSAFETLYHHFTGRQFNFDSSIPEELSELFTRMVQAHILIDEEEMEKMRNQILSNRERYENSFGFFLFHLTSYFWMFWKYDNDSLTRVMDESEIEQELKLLVYGMSSLNAFQYAFFQDIRGLQSISEGNVAEGTEFLKEACLYCPEVPVPGLRESIRYHIARISDKNRESLQGYLECLNLCNYYAATHNPVRYCYIENVMVYLLTDMKEFTEAHRHAVSLMNAAKTMKDPDVEYFIAMTLVWNAIAAGWDDLALSYIQNPRYTRHLSLHITGFEPLCLYRSGQIEEARESLKVWKNRPRPKKIELLHAVVADLIEERKRMFLRSCSAFESYCRKNGFRQSERLAHVLKLEMTRKFGMEDEYVKAVHEYLKWEHPKPPEPQI